MDDERIKADGSVLTERYFEEQLQHIREIRLSERKFSWRWYSFVNCCFLIMLTHKPGLGTSALVRLSRQDQQKDQKRC